MSGSGSTTYPINHEMDCSTAWLGAHPPRYTRSYQRYTLFTRDFNLFFFTPSLSPLNPLSTEGVGTEKNNITKTMSGAPPTNSEKDDKEDFGDWQEEFDDPAHCLISGKLCANIQDAIASTEGMGFDFTEIVKGRSPYDRMKIINYVRRGAGERGATATALAAEIADTDAWRDDANLTPFLADDALLYVIPDIEVVDDDDEDLSTTLATTVGGPNNDGLVIQLNEIRRENVELKKRFQRFFEDDDDGLNVAIPTESSLSVKDLSDHDMTSSPTSRMKKRMSASMFSHIAPLSVVARADVSFSRTEYDKAWVSLYENLFSKNATAILKDKRVLDLNCGFGVSSMLAAKCGKATHVVAYQPEDGKAAEMLSMIVKRNAYDDRVTVEENNEGLRNQIQNGKFQALLFPWSTACLLPLDSLTRLIKCREEFAESGAVVLPDMFTMHAAGFCVNAANLLNTTSFDFTPFCEDLRESAVSNHLGLHQNIPQTSLSTYSVKYKTFDLTKVVTDELEFTESFVLSPFLAGSIVSGLVCCVQSFWCKKKKGVAHPLDAISRSSYPPFPILIQTVLYLQTTNHRSSGSRR